MQYTQKYQKREKKMKDFESLKTSTKNKVLTVVFNRPEKMNTFSGQMLKLFCGKIRTCQKSTYQDTPKKVESFLVMECILRMS